MKRQGGFTLIEVVVAIAVLAIALGAASRAVGNSIDAQAQLRQRILAGWIAENQLAELHAFRHWPDPGKTEGEASMGTERFSWHQTVSTTPNPQFRRIDVVIETDSGRGRRELARLTGFLTGPNS